MRVSLHQQTNAHINNLQAFVAHDTAFTNLSREGSEFSVSPSSSLLLLLLLLFRLFLLFFCCNWCEVCSDVAVRQWKLKPKSIIWRAFSLPLLLTSFPALILFLSTRLLQKRQNEPLELQPTVRRSRLSISVLTRLKQKKDDEREEEREGEREVPW